MRWFKPIYGLILAGVSLFIVCIMPIASAADNLSQAFKTNQDIPLARLISLSSNGSETVELANTNNGDRLVGISVSTDDSLIAVNPEGGNVQVAINGTAEVLVSDIEGDIAVGDPISVSPFDGIGMKAPNNLRIIGLAQTAFGANDTATQTQEVLTKDGQSRQVRVGTVMVGISVTSEKNQDQNQNALQKVTRSIIGRDVSTIRIILSLIILFVATVVIVSLIYASIYGGIISVGRNPLAKSNVIRGVGGAMVMVLLIVVLAASSIFFLLR